MPFARNIFRTSRAVRKLVYSISEFIFNTFHWKILTIKFSNTQTSAGEHSAYAKGIPEIIFLSLVQFAVLLTDFSICDLAFRCSARWSGCFRGALVRSMFLVQNVGQVFMSAPLRVLFLKRRMAVEGLVGIVHGTVIIPNQNPNSKH